MRDALLGRPSADIDLATPARPEDIIAALEKAGIKAVPTGIEHGTVTAVVTSPEPPRHFEITTLRRDVETYGRRARVAFDADWSEDAARRDFTINALYLDPDGTVHDPVGGLADLAARRVRFVGEPARRIAEDVLRVLRYYRFEARFGHGEGDEAARAACRDAAAAAADAVGRAGRAGSAAAAGGRRSDPGVADDARGRGARRDPARGDAARSAGAADRP